MGGAAALSSLANLFPKKSIAMPDKMTLVGLGDCILSRRVSVLKDRAFLDLVDLVRSADCAWGNCEVIFVDADEGYPAPMGLAMHTICEPWIADEFKWMGIDFVGTANNHTKDYGDESVLSTIKHLNRVGIGYAGSGRNLQEASRPRYVDTPGGRVGQVCCDASAPEWWTAAYSSTYTKGRPGLNPLRIDRKIMLDSQSFENLLELRSKLWNITVGQPYQHKEGTVLDFYGTKFSKGDNVSMDTITREEDLKRITEALAIARRNSRLVIQSIHSHEGYKKFESPAQFMQPFARACIDSGADVFFNTGPHLLRGIEIYKGKPIFYSLGNFFFQYETVKQIAAETYQSVNMDRKTRDPMKFYDVYAKIFKTKTYWESFIPLITYEKATVTEIKLYPVELGFEEDRYHRGTPVMARKKEGQEIIERLARLSKAFGTTIEYRDGIGIVNL
jgi:poly-gamma-glutamate synthesis protein (capsule biosynthesis protein)